MIVLHIAAVENNLFNGVCIAAPQHAVSQLKYATVGFINIKNIELNMLRDYQGIQLDFVEPFDVNHLPDPFNKPDVVIFHECYRPKYLKIAKNLIKNNIPYIVMPHGELGEEAQKKKHLKKIAANILLFNSFTRCATAIVCLSKNEFDSTHFGKRKVLISNGVNIPLKKKEVFNLNRVKYIYIGRLDPFHKGLDLLIEAVSLVKNAMIANNATVDIYGPDILGRFDYVSNLIEKADVKEIIKLHHEISGKYKEEILLDSDVFIQTSRFEGLPLGVLEALSYGLPCLVTFGTNLANEIVDNCAGWCGGMSSEEIAHALLKSMNEKRLFYEYGNNGRMLVEKDYSWDVIGSRSVNEFVKITNYSTEY